MRDHAQAVRPELSIVIPSYNEETNLRVLYEHLQPVLTGLDITWEIIFSDDGSSDRTWDIIQDLHQENNNVRGIRLSRNFGHQYALFAGLQYALGNAVISMDADLQHPPEVIPQLVAQWRKGHKIVNTVRIDPADFSLMKRVLAKVFYKIFSLLCGVKLEHGMADFRLLDRKVIDELLHFREEGLFLRGLVQWVGYPNTNISFQCGERYSGVSKYSLRKMIKFAWHGLSSFSVIPLRIGIGVGILTSLLSFMWLAEAIYTKVVLGTVVPGWASTVGILSFLFGILFIFLGLIGEYVGRILIQVRERPLFIVADRIGFGDGINHSLTGFHENRKEHARSQQESSANSKQDSDQG